MDSSALVPVVMGWLCVKVDVKGPFVPAQQSSMGETTEDKPEYNPVTGHAA